MTRDSSGAEIVSLTSSDALSLRAAQALLFRVEQPTSPSSHHHFHLDEAKKVPTTSLLISILSGWTCSQSSGFCCCRCNHFFQAWETRWQFQGSKGINSPGPRPIVNLGGVGGSKSESVIVDSEDADCVKLWLLLLIPLLLAAPLMEAEAEISMADSLVKGCEGVEECGAALATGPLSFLKGLHNTGAVSKQTAPMSAGRVRAERHIVFQG